MKDGEFTRRSFTDSVDSLPFALPAVYLHPVTGEPKKKLLREEQFCFLPAIWVPLNKTQIWHVIQYFPDILELHGILQF